MDVQFLSDVHADLRKANVYVKPAAPVLVVAGDVDSHADPSYRDRLQALFSNHKSGAYVPGNHDYWGATAPLPAVADYISRVCASLDSCVTVLRDGNWGYDVPNTDTRVLGATLWTHIPDSLAYEAPSLLNDFQYIRTDPSTLLSVDDVVAQHARDKEWISKAIDRAVEDGKRVVVVTHHAPDLALAILNGSKSTNGLGLFYYCDDMRDVIRKPGISAWIYGHTHESRMMRLRGVPFPFLTNAMGYPGEKTGFAEGAKLSVE